MTKPEQRGLNRLLQSSRDASLKAFKMPSPYLLQKAIEAKKKLDKRVQELTDKYNVKPTQWKPRQSKK